MNITNQYKSPSGNIIISIDNFYIIQLTIPSAMNKTIAQLKQTHLNPDFLFNFFIEAGYKDDEVLKNGEEMKFIYDDTIVVTNLVLQDWMKGYYAVNSVYIMNEDTFAKLKMIGFNNISEDFINNIIRSHSKLLFKGAN
jgi:hypothetical protein